MIRRPSGFTLLELLVAVAIFALLSAMAYSGIASVITTREGVERNMTRLAEVQRTVMALGSDLRLAANRGIRDEYGDLQQPMVSNPLSRTAQGALIELTRAGYPNPLGLPRSDLQRVAYLIEDQTLYRLTWPELDRSQDTLPRRTALAGGVLDLSFRYLDRDLAWHEQWPPASGASTPLPDAVELILELEDWDEITRLYSLAGGS